MSTESHSTIEDDAGPVPTVAEVVECQVSSWYPKFAKLTQNSLGRTKGTIATVCIDLPADFRAYLLTDGVQLPVGAKTSSLLSNQDEQCSSDEEEDVGDSTEELSAPPSAVSFPELDDAISAAIQELGGSVAPKLNWSAPKDAVWMNGGSLQCRTPGDVYLLLKSSDFCLYDVQHALTDIRRLDDTFESTIATSFQLQLALRKWCNLYPSSEFRCFVRGGDLVAISQRHHSQHFPHLRRDRFLFRSLLVEFFDEIVQERFAEGSMPDYVFDAYVDRKEKVWLLDFNVWGRRTDTLLFTWSELASLDTDSQPEIRVVETEKQVRVDPLASYRAPIDTLHVASMSNGNGSEKFEDFMKLCERPSVIDAENDQGTP